MGASLSHLGAVLLLGNVSALTLRRWDVLRSEPTFFFFF